MKINLIMVTAIALLSSCTRKDDSIRVLKSAGYSNIEITGWRPFMAGRDDMFSTGFRAISPNGDSVSGAVTGGILKGSTIRLD